MNRKGARIMQKTTQSPPKALAQLPAFWKSIDTLLGTHRLRPNGVQPRGFRAFRSDWSPVIWSLYMKSTCCSCLGKAHGLCGSAAELCLRGRAWCRKGSEAALWLLAVSGLKPMGPMPRTPTSRSKPPESKRMQSDTIGLFKELQVTSMSSIWLKRAQCAAAVASEYSTALRKEMLQPGAPTHPTPSGHPL